MVRSFLISDATITPIPLSSGGGLSFLTLVLASFLFEKGGLNPR
jgi:hypothetical protein